MLSLFHQVSLCSVFLFPFFLSFVISLFISYLVFDVLRAVVLNSFMFLDITTLLATCFMLFSILHYSWTLKTKAICSSERQLTFNGLRSVISQKIKNSCSSLFPIFFSSFCGFLSFFPSSLLYFFRSFFVLIVYVLFYSFFFVSICLFLHFSPVFLVFNAFLPIILFFICFCLFIYFFLALHLSLCVSFHNNYIL
jgi:hypothetical protein